MGYMHITNLYKEPELIEWSREAERKVCAQAAQMFKRRLARVEASQ